jgi:uncharacterized membrane protein
MDFTALLSEAWRRFVDEIVQLVLFALLGTLLCLTIVLIPTVVGGFFRGFLGYVRDGRVPAFDELWRFDDYLPLLLLIVLGSVAIAIGYLLLFVPGVILSVWWLYAVFFLLDREMGVVEALGASKAAVSASGFFNHLVVLLIVSLLGALGGSLSGLGTIFTTPFALVFLSLCYLELRE